MPEHGVRERFSLGTNVFEVHILTQVFGYRALAGYTVSTLYSALYYIGTWVFGAPSVWTQPYFVWSPGTKCEHNLSRPVLNIHLVLGVEIMARQTESQLTKQKE